MSHTDQNQANQAQAEPEVHADQAHANTANQAQVPNPNSNQNPANQAQVQNPDHATQNLTNSRSQGQQNPMDPQYLMGLQWLQEHRAAHWKQQPKVQQQQSQDQQQQFQAQQQQFQEFQAQQQRSQEFQAQQQQFQAQQQQSQAQQQQFPAPQQQTTQQDTLIALAQALLNQSIQSQNKSQDHTQLITQINLIAIPTAGKGSSTGLSAARRIMTTIQNNVESSCCPRILLDASVERLTAQALHNKVKDLIPYAAANDHAALNRLTTLQELWARLTTAFMPLPSELQAAEAIYDESIAELQPLSLQSAPTSLLEQFAVCRTQAHNYNELLRAVPKNSALESLLPFLRLAPLTAMLELSSMATPIAHSLLGKPMFDKFTALTLLAPEASELEAKAYLSSCEATWSSQLRNLRTRVIPKKATALLAHNDESTDNDRTIAQLLQEVESLKREVLDVKADHLGDVQAAAFLSKSQGHDSSSSSSSSSQSPASDWQVKGGRGKSVKAKAKYELPSDHESRQPGFIPCPECVIIQQGRERPSKITHSAGKCNTKAAEREAATAMRLKELMAEFAAFKLAASKPAASKPAK